MCRGGRRSQERNDGGERRWTHLDREAACPRFQNGRSVVQVEPPNLPHPRSETPSAFVVPSLWRTCPNLIGPFIHPTAPQTLSVARRAMPQSHVAPHHLVCSKAQSTRILCQCRLLNEEIRERGHLSGATARLCMKLLRDRAGASSLVRLCRPVSATAPARAARSAPGCLLFWRGFQRYGF